jgi:hypothetical protein
MTIFEPFLARFIFFCSSLPSDESLTYSYAPPPLRYVIDATLETLRFFFLTRFFFFPLCM